MQPALHVVMYHYVRDLARTPYPELKAMPVEDFRRQVDELAGRFEMGTLESSLAFLKGSYRPARDLCLLTFDDGVKEHFREVTPLLADRGIEGLFFLITGAIENKRVAPVHMNHFLMAALGFERYRMVFLRKLADIGWAADMTAPATVKATYPWDNPEIGAFKYLFNFVLSPPVRDRIVRELFEEAIGPEAAFSEELYVSWDEARMMQEAGMILGGHTQEHRPLATLNDEELQKDLAQCRQLLEERVGKQEQWPFCYPYGKKTSFDGRAVEQLKKLGFVCGFSTETGINAPGYPVFEIHRVDCNKAWKDAWKDPQVRRPAAAIASR